MARLPPAEGPPVALVATLPAEGLATAIAAEPPTPAEGLSPGAAPEPLAMDVSPALAQDSATDVCPREEGKPHGNGRVPGKKVQGKIPTMFKQQPNAAQANENIGDSEREVKAQKRCKANAKAEAKAKAKANTSKKAKAATAAREAQGCSPPAKRRRVKTPA